LVEKEAAMPERRPGRRWRKAEPRTRYTDRPIDTGMRLPVTPLKKLIKNSSFVNQTFNSEDLYTVTEPVYTVLHVR
jgi:hypothetical protein